MLRWTMARSFLTQLLGVGSLFCVLVLAQTSCSSESKSDKPKKAATPAQSGSEEIPEGEDSVKYKYEPDPDVEEKKENTDVYMSPEES